MKTLLSDALWVELSKKFAKHKRIRAAIAYVTTNHLDFRKGDLLVCDASDSSIKGGKTSASTLRSFFNEGAEIYSYDGLHSKVAIIDEYALIGSANLSENAGVGTCEASLLTDDLQIGGLIQAFVEAVKDESKRVDEKFLKRIEALPVVQAKGITRSSKKKVNIGTSRVWFIATRVLDDKIAEVEAEYESKGLKRAVKNIEKTGYEIRSLRWTGKSRFRAEAKQGDLVIEALTTKRGKRNYVQIFRAASIRHRQDHEKWTRFYIEVPPERKHFLWKDIKAKLDGLGVSGINPNSVKELSGAALGILQRMG